jgi:hypothetical protein
MTHRNPTEGVDWTEEPFHQAFVRNHVYRHAKWPAGFVVWIYVGILAAFMWGLYTLVQWWTGA